MEGDPVLALMMIGLFAWVAVILVRNGRVDMTDRFDARATWAALDDEQRRRIGEAAVLLQVSTEAQMLSSVFPDPTPERLLADRRWCTAEQIAWAMLEEMVPADADLFDGPDLLALGIRSCRVCGCTDEFGCTKGCSWVEFDLCSACASEAGGG